MRCAILIFAAILVSGSIQVAEPTTRPTVLLLRFAQLNDSPGMEWVGRVMQESLLTDAARDRSVRVSTSQDTPTTDIATARRIARDAKADIVVLGGYQVIADDLKITGQVADVESGEIIGTLKSTATVRDCLTMEETIARQLSRSLNRQQQPAPSAEAKVDYEPLGPVRVANYVQTFGIPKSDPHQMYRDRYTYGLPAYSPYLSYGYGCGWYGYRSPYGCYFGSSWITPTGIFYGD